MNINIRIILGLDLWFYIREAVTNANPLSPEELIKKLIDAVQAVPTKLMKPVVEASIKRSQSIDLTTIGNLLLMHEHVKHWCCRNLHGNGNKWYRRQKSGTIY